MDVGATAPKPPRAKFEKPAVETLRLLAVKSGMPESEGDRFFDHYEANGWMVGRTPMKNWEATMRTWRRNYEERKYQVGRSGSGKPNPRLDGVSQNNSVNNYEQRARERRSKAEADLAAKVAANQNGSPPKT